ncbi:DUF5129 domain-containing protein [Dietzia psychralcaliphila]|uniref:DUF5129 domain-containing protein n=1 Tax=Dietzia psychralcaliphila TaxID=139021 RepID=A0AAD0JNB2_9ACTN|nr:DUF5129 domain-containing protein [Dietzia psychralcaliphila]AWH94398.1 hypothetical protein A6048_01450 [Dietzia psychralcaliphila]PTM88030.1 putative membrane protein YgcG [Dietzia psychralcaliphila]
MISSVSRLRLLLVVLSGAAALLLFLLPLAPAGAQAPAPAPAPGQATAVGVGITDGAGVLSPGDQDLLRTETERIAFPPQVQQVEYLVFDDGNDNLNDTTERFAQAERPDLVSEDREKWAPGTLIVANDVESRQVGIYCGDDVCAALDIFEGRHLDGSLEAMKDPMRRDNHAVGLLAGAQAAADPTVLAPESEGMPSWLPWALGGAGVVGAGAIGAAVAASRKKEATTARERYDRVSREYGRVAGELTGLDIRANSLTSPLADDELRSQWEDVRDRFLALDTVMGRIGDLRPESKDSEFREKAADIETAHTTVDQMETAEKNIDQLFRMEQGDADVRRRQLGELHEDMLAAALGTEDERLAAEAKALDARADELSKDTQAADFMDRYARLVVDYRLVVEAIRVREMSDVEAADDAGDRHAPRLYDRDWRAGYGYNGFVPFYVVSSWHAHDVQAAEAASSATNTSYSNASFSGGGGSSGY